MNNYLNQLCVLEQAHNHFDPPVSILRFFFYFWLPGQQNYLDNKHFLHQLIYQPISSYVMQHNTF